MIAAYAYKVNVGMMGREFDCIVDFLSNFFFAQLFLTLTFQVENASGKYRLVCFN